MGVGRAFLKFVAPSYDPGWDRKFVGSSPQGFACCIFSYVGNFVEHSPPSHNSYPVIDGTFAAAHSSFGRTGAHRLGWEQSDPQLTSTLYETCDGAPRSFDLTSGNPAGTFRLKAELSVDHRRAAGPYPVHAAAVFFAVFSAFWLKHG
jgi:hypothetical protein